MLNHQLVISVQDEDWDDDGGDHNPYIVQVTDEELKIIESGKTVSYRWVTKLHRVTDPQYPIQIDGVFTVWTR